MIDVKKIRIKYRASTNFVLWHRLYPLLKSVRVSEFPKSGGTWLCQMLAECSGLEFPRNRALPLKKCIHHAHYKGPSNHPTIILIRDGRDIMVSAYFHFLFYNKQKPKFLVDYWRGLVPADNYDNVAEVLPKFIKAFSENFKIGGQRVTWSEHVLSYDKESKHHCFLKYEDLLSAPLETLTGILNWMNQESKKDLTEIIEKYSFSNQARRESGEENRSAFLRKGISGDWKNYFSEEAIDVFNDFHDEGYKYWQYD